MSGGPYRSIVQVKEGDFCSAQRRTQTLFKVGDSGNRRELSFCVNCGSHIYATSVVEDVPKGSGCWAFAPGLLAEVAQLAPRSRCGASLRCFGQKMSFRPAQVWTQAPPDQ